MPFLRATRQNFLPVQSLDYAAGDTKVVRLPQVGLLARVICIFEGTNTVTLGGGTAVLGAEAPFSLIQRLRLVANGNTNVFDMSGYGAMIASLFSAYGFSGYGGRPRIPDSATVPGPASTAMSAANYGAGVSAGANTWRFGLDICSRSPTTGASPWGSSWPRRPTRSSSSRSAGARPSTRRSPPGRRRSPSPARPSPRSPRPSSTPSSSTSPSRRPRATTRTSVVSTPGPRRGPRTSPRTATRTSSCSGATPLSGSPTSSGRTRPPTAPTSPTCSCASTRTRSPTS